MDAIVHLQQEGQHRNVFVIADPTALRVRTIAQIIAEKREYNAQRHDHQKHVREKDGGKAY